MSVNISIDARKITIFSPPTRGVDNAMTIGIIEDEGVHSLTIFGLPDHVADALAAGIDAASKAEPYGSAEHAIERQDAETEDEGA